MMFVLQRRDKPAESYHPNEKQRFDDRGGFLSVLGAGQA
jgi:hypothetical protein